ncbi:MAG: type III pantothenate kinase [Pseudomonadota bacterium]
MQGAVLYVDQGNTRAKFWLVRAGQVLCRGSVSDAADLQRQLGEQRMTGIVLATVKSADEASALLAPWRDTLPAPVSVSVCKRILPTAYDDPTKLGIDRWLGVLAAKAMGEGAALVVDAGTAITVDVLTDQGIHAGGYILPGLAMQQNALAAETVRVKFSLADWQAQSLGTNTAAAVGHGSIRAICALVREVAHELGQLQASRVYLTGGNAQDLMQFLPQAQVVDDLLLIGMQAYMQAVSRKLPGLLQEAGQ